AAPAAEAPLGESTRSAEAAAPTETPAPTGNAMQTAEAAPPSVVKATTTDTPTVEDVDKSAPSLSSEQQELAAEVGDTRHASAPSASDKAPD
ncbi:MAG: hypothetical protein ACYDD1_12960, partial [Caulobacteraceae bacterium]